MARTSSTPDIEITDPVEAVRKKYDNILIFVIGVLFLGFVTLLLTVFGLVIDAFNNKAATEQELITQQQELIDQLNNMPTSISILKSS